MSNLRILLDGGAKIFNHGLQEFDTGQETLEAGFLGVAGAFLLVKGINNICSGKLEKGVLESVVGVVIIVYATYRLTITWEPVFKDSATMHCRKWAERDSKKITAQYCNVLSCTPPESATTYDLTHCAMLGQSPGQKGFQNIHDMKNAKTIAEKVIVLTRNPKGQPGICTYYPLEQKYKCQTH